MLLQFRKSNPFMLYVIMILLGIGVGVSEIHVLHTLAQTICDIFIKIFKCISLPIIALSLIVTLCGFINANLNQLLRKTAFYTFGTTIVAATIACLLYVLIRPGNVSINDAKTLETTSTHAVNYWQYLSTLIPSNLLSPFLENQVISVLLVSILLGSAIRYIPDKSARDSVINLFKGLHALFLIITRWVIAILPIGLFGFITTTVLQFKQGMNLTGIGQYLSIIILANCIQGLIILPIWLKSKGISPFKTMRLMMPALSLAFFSKSSAGTLPVTMATAEKNLNLDPNISRFILPLCTSINMNGCAAFIFTTVIFLMQNAGIEITTTTLLLWIIISTVAAIGNAGVPMGCFFLSASLLASMDVPIILMGIILPFYSLIDMLETSLNVWSDSCVAKVIDDQFAPEAIPVIARSSSA